MTWIVGIDLRRTGTGALRYASWLAQQSRGEGGELLVGVHVLEPDLLRAQLRYRRLAEVLDEASRATREHLEREGAAPHLREVRVVHGTRADQGLVDACGQWHARAVIIGRLAERRSHRLVRLGPVARRLVSQAPIPVVVVPPDMQEKDFGDGALVALSELTEESVEACLFASQLARRLGRRLLIAMVAAPRRGSPWRAVFPHEPAEAPPVPPDEPERRRLRDWVASSDLHPDEATVMEAEDAAEEVADLASRWRAPLLVVGATHLRGLERLVASNAARTLAARARCPVAVVPARS